MELKKFLEIKHYINENHDYVDSYAELSVYAEVIESVYVTERDYMRLVLDTEDDVIGKILESFRKLEQRVFERATKFKNNIQKIKTTFEDKELEMIIEET